MAHANQIPSLADLALHYGTITADQNIHLQKLHVLKLSQGHKTEFDELMQSQNFATGYQIGLLKLIQEYLIIKKQGEAFGKIAIEKGFATQEDIAKALEYQKKEFKRAKIKKLIGDILVESSVITIKQKNTILKEQVFLDVQAEKIYSQNPREKTVLPKNTPVEKDIQLDEYEQKFLQIQVLDKEFAASIIEKGFASEREVCIAQKVQEEEFEKKHSFQILGDLMVQLNYITEDQKNIILEEQNRIESSDRPDADPAIRILIRGKNMEATAILNRDVRTVTIQQIRQELGKKGIQYGIFSDAVLQCNLDMGNTEFLAAIQDFAIEQLKDKKVRYHFNVQGIDTEIKKSGATLAERSPSGEPHVKKDLFGHNIEQVPGDDPPFRCGTGTRFSMDRTKAIAGKTGFPSLSVEKKLYVHPMISVLEDADLRYGPLEKYANLKISGVLTGAYPVTAGNVHAREIRGAKIHAIGMVKSEIGITDAVINAQGDVYASYLHHCRIETYGNVYIENEIIDSQVFSSGKIDSGSCRVISSTLFGKNGVTLAGAGSSRTRACIIGAGTEHHLLEQIRQINGEIKTVKRKLDELKEKRDEQDLFSKKVFQKMIELKIFHDRAKIKKQKLAEEFQNKKASVKKESLKNLVKLIQTFEKRMENSIIALKELNETRKQHEKEKIKLENKIEKLEPGIQKRVSDLQFDLFSNYEWARRQNNVCHIQIHQKAFPGTQFKGIYSSMALEDTQENFFIVEQQTAYSDFNLHLQKG